MHQFQKHLCLLTVWTVQFYAITILPVVKYLFEAAFLKKSWFLRLIPNSETEALVFVGRVGHQCFNIWHVVNGSQKSTFLTKSPFKLYYIVALLIWTLSLADTHNLNLAGRPFLIFIHVSDWFGHSELHCLGRDVGHSAFVKLTVLLPVHVSTVRSGGGHKAAVWSSVYGAHQDCANARLQFCVYTGGWGSSHVEPHSGKTPFCCGPSTYSCHISLMFTAI